jgi:hypothetical protein
MIEFIGALYNLLQHFTIFDWTLSTSDHTTLIHSSWNQSLTLIQPRDGFHRKHVCYIKMDVLYCCVFVGTCSPINGLFARICVRGKMFIEPFPSNGFIGLSIHVTPLLVKKLTN